jgi:hypothetical protein
MSYNFSQQYLHRKQFSVQKYVPALQVFDPRTSKQTQINMVFYSKFGEREDPRRPAKKTIALVSGGTEVSEQMDTTITRVSTL